MAGVSSNERGSSLARGRVVTLVAVFAIFVVALFLRAYWNVDAATSDGYAMSAGSDPYYHKRAVDYIQDNGWKTLVYDPLLNYPYGANNPNPPLFQWSVAVGGAMAAPFFGGDLDAATWWAMLWSPAFWGALTVIPVYLLGRDVFDRRTGVIAAFILAVSTTHMEHTSLGAADHDSMLLFFATFAFWAYARAIQGFRGDGNWVGNWASAADRSAGLGRFFRERRAPIGWAALAGVFTGLVALIWKGFPYLIGVFFAYAALQLVVDHWRSKDSLGVWFGTLVAMLVATLVAYPAYSAIHVASFLKPVWFLVAVHAVFGLVMVPTRDFPTLLILPAFAVVGALVAAVAYFALPDVWRSLLYATVYFKQTALYKTIAEAQPADFNILVFGVGPVAFLLALVGAAWLLVASRKNPTRASLFMLVWAVLAVYMAWSAVRFLFNATPVLALLAAYAIVLVLDWVDFRSIARNMSGAPSFWAGMRRAVNGWHYTIAILIAILLVFPSVFLAVDAAAPGEVEEKWVRNYLVDFLDAHRGDHNFTRAELADLPVGQFNFGRPSGLWHLWFNERAVAEGLDPKGPDGRGLTPESREEVAAWGGMPVFIAKRFGAFGQGFLPDYWRSSLGELAATDDWGPSDASKSLQSNRPAFLSWWDYGHWAIEVGKHPAVADNFQNGYEYAANFLLSGNETHAVQLLAARSLDRHDAEGRLVTAGLVGEADAKKLLGDAGVDPAKVDKVYANVTRWQFDADLALEAAVRFEGLVTESTADAARFPHRPDGVRIRYFAADIRMMPLDLSSTPNIDQGSIFTAPVTLAGRTAADFVEVKYAVGGTDYTEDDYLREAKAVTRHRAFQATAVKYEYKRPFFDSMYYRAFVGTLPIDPTTGRAIDLSSPVRGDPVAQALETPKPAIGLKHWRASIVNEGVRVLEYYPGAILKGRITVGGEPLANARVTAYDDIGAVLFKELSEFEKLRQTPDSMNVEHDSVSTDANGEYTLILPFSRDDGNVTVKAELEGVTLVEKKLKVTRAQAGTGRPFGGDGNITVEKGGVEGRVFFDRNEDGRFDATNDTLESGIVVAIGGRNATSDATGNYSISDVSPGVKTVSVESEKFEVRTDSAEVPVPPSRSTTHDVGLVLTKVSLSGSASFEGLEGANATASSVRVAFTAVTGTTARNVTVVTGADGTYTQLMTPGRYIVKASHVTANDTYEFEGALDIATADVDPAARFDVVMRKKV